MSKKKKNIFLNPWSIGVGSSVLGVLSIRIIDTFAGTGLSSSLWSLVKLIFVSVLGFFTQTFQWKLYSLILLFVSGPIMGIAIFWFISKIQDAKEDLKPNWLKYRKDTFKGVVYKWEYQLHSDGKYRITDVKPFCVRCECMLVHEKCPNCSSQFYDKLQSLTVIESLILHRIDNMGKDS